jgi:hypothetical protein
MANVIQGSFLAAMRSYRRLVETNRLVVTARHEEELAPTPRRFRAMQPKNLDVGDDYR